jgi:hypothetical protein
MSNVSQIGHGVRTAKAVNADARGRVAKKFFCHNYDTPNPAQKGVFVLPHVVRTFFAVRTDSF